MTDRELIYNTLLNGIPYGIMGSVMHYDEETNEPVEIDGQIKGIRSNGYVEFYYPDGSFNLFRIHDVKPYLRPMNSMTEEEEDYYDSITYTEDETHFKGIWCNNVVNWLNKKMFDYCGMIIKGLALPAKDGMYSPPIWAFVPTGGR